MNPFLRHLSTLLLRDLDKLEKEITLYPSPSTIWAVRGEIINPAGNLCLHLCGNLQYYIGTVLGNTGYERHRDKEFSLKDIPVEDLILQIRATKEVIRKVLPLLDTRILEADYPVVVYDGPMNTQYFLIHLAGHLNYHLGQVNYHRRLVSVS